LRHPTEIPRGAAPTIGVLPHRDLPLDELLSRPAADHGAPRSGGVYLTNGVSGVHG
jgi:hypothetical protein